MTGVRTATRAEALTKHMNDSADERCRMAEASAKELLKAALLLKASELFSKKLNMAAQSDASGCCGWTAPEATAIMKSVADEVLYDEATRQGRSRRTSTTTAQTSTGWRRTV